MSFLSKNCFKSGFRFAMAINKYKSCSCGGNLLSPLCLQYAAFANFSIDICRSMKRDDPLGNLSL